MKTKIFTLTAIALLLTVTGGLATQPETVQGEYLEARSVSVYVGACHYGAEYVEGGREATLVWNIRQGTWKGVSLDGLTVVAVVTAQNNLAIDTDTRRSVLYLNEAGGNIGTTRCLNRSDEHETRRDSRRDC